MNIDTDTYSLTKFKMLLLLISIRIKFIQYSEPISITNNPNEYNVPFGENSKVQNISSQVIIFNSQLILIIVIILLILAGFH